MLLAGQIALVTGAASGIGAATCDVLAGAGATVVGLDRAFSEALPECLPAARRLCADVSKPAAVEAAFRTILRDHGQLDVVVHAAGVDDRAIKDKVHEQTSAGQPVLTLPAITAAQWTRMRSINLDGAFYVLQESSRVMVPRRRGAIVLIGSEAAVHGLPGLVHYGASKGGVHALTRSAGTELAAFGVRVNGIAPGVIDTPMSRRSRAYSAATVAPLGRLGEAAEIGKVALFLASDLASYVVGEVVNVDGGRLAC